MFKKNKDDKWDSLFESIFSSKKDFLHQASLGVQDIYKTWLKKENITNTGLHRKERIDENGTEDIIK